MASTMLSVLLATTLAPRLAVPHKAFALWLVVLARVNGALQFVENSLWLAMLSVSQNHPLANPLAKPTYAVLAVAVRVASRWAHCGHILVLVSWLMVLYLCLLRAHLVPRWLAIAGIVAALPHVFGIPLAQFVGYRVPSDAMWGVPLALGYHITSFWLLARGFARAPEVPAPASSP